LSGWHGRHPAERLVGRRGLHRRRRDAVAGRHGGAGAVAGDGQPGQGEASPHRRGSRGHPAVGAELRRVPVGLHAGLTAGATDTVSKPLTTPARGMRDFLPEDVRKRSYVIGVVRDVYERYGFEPLETPAVENIETLLGKYGEEGDRLIFKILK